MPIVDITSGDISPGNDGLTGYLAIPASGRGPGVVVIQEWWGLVPHIQSVADRLAEAGFVALAPDLFRGVATTEPDEAGKLMMGLGVAEAGSDIAATANHLVRSGLLTGAQVGCVGFCMGGGLALLAPTVSPDLDCTVAFYPAMPWPDYHPDWARYSGKEALVHECEADVPSTGEDIARYAEQIAAHGGIAVVEAYAGTQHAFFNDDRPEVHDPKASALAWERTISLLHRRLDGPFR
jgi:carboxymethylenebutenolidase